MTDILNRIDNAVAELCPWGGTPRPGSAWCSDDCEPVPGAGESWGGYRPLESAYEDYSDDGPPWFFGYPVVPSHVVAQIAAELEQRDEQIRAEFLEALRRGPEGDPSETVTIRLPSFRRRGPDHQHHLHVSAAGYHNPASEGWQDVGYADPDQFELSRAPETEEQDNLGAMVADFARQHLSFQVTAWQQRFLEQMYAESAPAGHTDDPCPEYPDGLHQPRHVELYGLNRRGVRVPVWPPVGPPDQYTPRGRGARCAGTIQTCRCSDVYSSAATDDR